MRRDYPRFQDLTGIGEAADEVARAIDAIERLDRSHLLIQGPPGAGKTYTASHAIVEMIARGNRVGVSSHSHKARFTSLGGTAHHLRRSLLIDGGKGAVDSGRTRDKVPGFDPGAAPLGTDEESAGAPPFLDGAPRTSVEPGAAAEAAANPNGDDRSRYRAQHRMVWPVIVRLTLTAAAAALVAALLS